MTQTSIDIEHIKQYVGDDTSIISELFDLFGNQVETWAKHLQPDADDDLWESCAHTLKGSALAVGAHKLAELCQIAEDMVGDETPKSRRKAIAERIETEIDAVNIDIQRWQYRQTISDLRT